MYKFRIIAVGKIKEKFYQSACDEYLKRLTAFSKTEVVEVNEYRCNADFPTQAEINNVLLHEGQSIRSFIPKGYAVVPLCVEGNRLNSPGLACKIEDFIMKGMNGVCFIIGGSYGLSDEIKSIATYKLSMSDLTFPHMLARVMLLEQLYRSMNILKNGKYHK